MTALQRLAEVRQLVSDADKSSLGYTIPFEDAGVAAVNLIRDHGEAIEAALTRAEAGEAVAWQLRRNSDGKVRGEAVQNAEPVDSITIADHITDGLASIRNIDSRLRDDIRVFAGCMKPLYLHPPEEAGDGEAIAEAIYSLMPYDERGSKPAWVPRGNSLKQDEARRYAQAAIAARKGDK